MPMGYNRIQVAPGEWIETVVGRLSGLDDLGELEGGQKASKDPL